MEGAKSTNIYWLYSGIFIVQYNGGEGEEGGRWRGCGPSAIAPSWKGDFFNRFPPCPGELWRRGRGEGIDRWVWSSFMWIEYVSKISPGWNMAPQNSARHSVPFYIIKGQCHKINIILLGLTLWPLAVLSYTFLSSLRQNAVIFFKLTFLVVKHVHRFLSSFCGPPRMLL